MPTIKDLQSATKSFARREVISIEREITQLDRWVTKTTSEVDERTNGLRKQLKRYDEEVGGEFEHKLTKTLYYHASHFHKRMSRLLADKNNEILLEVFPQLERVALLGRLSNETLSEYNTLSERFNALETSLERLGEYLEQAREILGFIKSNTLLN